MARQGYDLQITRYDEKGAPRQPGPAPGSPRDRRRALFELIAGKWISQDVSVGRITDGRPIEWIALGRVISIREVGGLHHRYVRRAA